MPKTERSRSACRALADTTNRRRVPQCSVSNYSSSSSSSFITSSKAKMSLCRACLVLLGAEDPAYDLCQEQELANKFFGCMAKRDNESARGGTLDEDTNLIFQLKCICECCYQLVQKFHDFQCMCQESLRNFETMLLEVDPEVSSKLMETPLETPLEACEPESMLAGQSNDLFIRPELIEEIEEVYIMDDEVANECLAKEKIAIRTQLKQEQSAARRQRGVRNKMDCPICSRGFYKMSLYEAHMQRHRGEQPYRCIVNNCGKTYARANLLRTHIEAAHQNDRTIYACKHPNCKKVYSSVRSLKYHVRRQHNQQEKTTARHTCDKCGKSYGRRAHLTRHQWVHRSTGDFRFGCDHCGLRFYTEQNLRDHGLRRHSHKQPLRCRRCGRIFETSATLAMHMKKKHIQLHTKMKL